MMKTNSHFVRENEIRKYNIQGEEIKLRLTRYMFPPSAEGIHYMGSIPISPDDNVIDIGTGSGLFAIFAAKIGANVTATDIYFKSLDDVPFNLQLNNVEDKVRLVLGEYFGSSSTQYDVIFANLPQEIVFPKYAREIGEQLITMDGGKDGNKSQLELLDIASEHMHENSRLYLPIYSMADYKKTLEKMCENFDVKLLGMHTNPVKDYVLADIKPFKKLNEKGTITMYKENDVWSAFMLYAELRKK